MSTHSFILNGKKVSVDVEDDGEGHAAILPEPARPLLRRFVGPGAAG